MQINGVSPYCSVLLAIGNSISNEWIIEEDKGIGINATDFDGNLFSIGSFQMVKHLGVDLSHALYLLKNNNLIATIDLVDEIKAGARETIQALKVSGMRVLLISGDKKSACEKVCKEVGIEEIYGEQLPRQKLERIESLSKESPTAMVGDGYGYGYGDSAYHDYYTDEDSHPSLWKRFFRSTRKTKL